MLILLQQCTTYLLELRRAVWFAAAVILAANLGMAGRPALAQDAEEEEPFSFRSDAELFQLEEAVAMIANALNKVADNVSLLAINSVRFGKDIRGDFRPKARVIFLEKLLNANPAIKLVQCNECEKLETKIIRGVLRIRKGVPTVEARRELAKKLGVHGFIDIGVYREGQQLTVYLQVMEAESGAIILVEELTGRRAAKRESYSGRFGEMIFPIKSGGKTVDHNALVFAFAESIQLTERLSFDVEFALYLDNNTNSSTATTTIDLGGVVAPTLGYDVMQFRSSASRLILYVGLGKLISTQFSFGNLYKYGMMFVVGDELEVQLGFNQFSDSDIDGGNTLTGSGYELRFGYRF